MVNSSRSTLRSSTARHSHDLQSTKLAPTEGNEAAENLNNKPSTRRATKSTTLQALSDNETATRVNSQPTLSRSRNNVRKKAATSLSTDAPGDRPKPPTKVTVTQPHGGLLQTTNGVQTVLGIKEDDIPSGNSTPNTNGASNGLSVPSSRTQDKRSLRSQDGGTRLKSDLSIYFANYDDIIANVPKQPEFLELDTLIYIVDEPSKSANPPTPPGPLSRASSSPSRSRKLKAHTPTRTPSQPSIPPKPPSTTFPVLDYTSISRHTRSDDITDPLSDSVYFASHRRAERKEKQLRNIEKERAMHEKVQLERLLDGLQGPDWLKVMGITGVTDGEKKDWEAKRDYFTAEVQALVDKFRIWKEEEKRLRAKREAALHAEEEAEEEDEEDEQSESVSPTPDPAAQQLQQEASSVPPKPRRPPRPQGYLLPLQPPEPVGPFTSFYSKPHLREAALGKHRHGRSVTAFGLPIPDFEPDEFSLPGDWLTPEALREQARKRRRLKREIAANKK